jgi:charged multivesicular body protein 7
MKAYESSTVTLRALLAHPSLQRDAVERTFDALADANADAQELDEAVRSGMDVAVGVVVSPDDEDEIEAELAALQAEVIAEARVGEKTLHPVAPGETLHDGVSEAAQQGRNRAETRDMNISSDRRPEKVLAG